MTRVEVVAICEIDVGGEERGESRTGGGKARDAEDGLSMAWTCMRVPQQGWRLWCHRPCSPAARRARQRSASSPLPPSSASAKPRGLAWEPLGAEGSDNASRAREGPRVSLPPAPTAHPLHPPAPPSPPLPHPHTNTNHSSLAGRRGGAGSGTPGIGARDTSTRARTHVRARACSCTPPLPVRLAPGGVTVARAGGGGGSQRGGDGARPT